MYFLERIKTFEKSEADRIAARTEAERIADIDRALAEINKIAGIGEPWH